MGQRQTHRRKNSRGKECWPGNRGKARREWERAFAVCHRLQNRPPVPEQLGNTRLTRRDPVQIADHSEVVRWAQVSGGGLAKKQCGLVEVVEDGGEWKVARGLVRVRGGGVLLWIANVHPFPRWRPLATIAGLEPSQVQIGCNMALQTPSPGEVVIDVRTTQAPAGAGSPCDAGLGTDEDILIEILASRTNKEIRDIKKAYKEEYKKELEDDIKSDTGGDFRNALLALCKANRSEDTLLNKQRRQSSVRGWREEERNRPVHLHRHPHHQERPVTPERWYHLDNTRLTHASQEPEVYRPFF
ncbi:hypothetical protein SKAU_G00014760 [Synaphobranchus kaupii]|uniref:Annexin n=1 Tax=Synaphobranchus kaupii TaxID=118154 RepID=A0A9Q1JCI9_SYNKA|nr:hypothetical protein SKAU_G00014760 [Synaphobranchus kaupii]